MSESRARSAPRIRRGWFNTWLVTMAVSRPVIADDGAAAEALFEAGRAAAKRGDMHEACARFRESHRLDPAPGTKLNLAVCENELGRLALAWRLLRTLNKSLAKDDPRLELVDQLLARLEARIPRVTLERAGPLPPGLNVRIGDSQISESGFGVPIPLDPGRHVFEVTAPGSLSVKHAVTLAEGERRALTIEAPPQKPGWEPLKELEHEPRASDDGAAFRTWGIVTLGAAGSALALGAATGLATIERKKTVDRLCDPDGCRPGGVEAARSGDKLGVVSTACFATGIGLAGAGTLLLLVGNSSSATRPSPRARPSVSVRATFSSVVIRAEL